MDGTARSGASNVLLDILVSDVTLFALGPARSGNIIFAARLSSSAKEEIQDVKLFTREWWLHFVSAKPNFPGSCVDHEVAAGGLGRWRKRDSGPPLLEPHDDLSFS